MSIPTRIFGESSSSNVILFVGGSGDSKDSFTSLIEYLIPLFPQHKFITFSFQREKEHSDLFLSQQIIDLREVLNTLIEKATPYITLIVTSDGAYSTSHVIIDKRFSQYIKSVIFLDPADYYLDTQVPVKGEQTWTGFQTYSPSKPTTSFLMGTILSDVKIHVVNFTIRNYDKDGYAAIEKRGEDNEKKYSRLNNDMVQSFYTRAPKKNKGLYIEDNTLPHAFMRDGNIQKNCKRITEILLQCLGIHK